MDLPLNVSIFNVGSFAALGTSIRINRFEEHTHDDSLAGRYSSLPRGVSVDVAICCTIVKNVVLSLYHEMASEASKLDFQPCVKRGPGIDTVHVNGLDPTVRVLGDEWFWIQTAFQMTEQATVDIEYDAISCERVRHKCLHEFLYG